MQTELLCRFDRQAQYHVSAALFPRTQFDADAAQFQINHAGLEHLFVEVPGRFAGFGMMMR
jgi:hypothetical protein